MEKVKQYKLVGGEEKAIVVPRYKPTGKVPNYNTPGAKALIRSQLKGMAYEVKSSTAGSSALIHDQYGRVSHRAFTPSTFPDYVQKSGAGSTKEFLKILSSKKGLRYDRLKTTAIDRLENGYQNQHGYDIPNTKFLVASKQLHDNKDIVFRRIRGRIVPMRVPHSKRYDLVPF